jgi:hypothetical protein
MGCELRKAERVEHALLRHAALAGHQHAPADVVDFVGGMSVGADREAAGRFPAQAEALRLYKGIATRDASARLPSLARQKPTWEKAATLVSEWGLNQLAERLQRLAEKPTSDGR